MVELSFMQALQSGTASVSEGNVGQFVALRHVVRQMKQMKLAAAGVGMRRPVVAACEAAAMPVALTGVAEGAGLAHDAGNLLGALSLYSDLLAMPGVLHEEHREYADELRMLSDRSWAMIDRLVGHARTGQPAKAAAGEIAVLPDVVSRCKGLLSRVAGRTVDVTYGVGAFRPVKVPVEAVERILTNLVKNAAEATPWVGAISIHIEGAMEQPAFEGGELRRRVMLTVRDRGCGMDAVAVRRLMQTGGIASANGRGLGFRVVRELVAISGGCLSVDSQPEVGTSVSAEWYEASREETEVQPMERGVKSQGRVKTVFEGEAGWIAC
jgi:signal transduction histidine kinase